jgi:hypothetical protein
VLGLALPAAQLTQAAEPFRAWYVPAAQALQLDQPGEVANAPAGHARHALEALAASSGLNLPAGQLMQLLCPALAL